MLSASEAAPFMSASHAASCNTLKALGSLQLLQGCLSGVPKGTSVLWLCLKRRCPRPGLFLHSFHFGLPGSLGCRGLTGQLHLHPTTSMFSELFWASLENEVKKRKHCMLLLASLAWDHCLLLLLISGASSGALNNH